MTIAPKGTQFALSNAYSVSIAGLSDGDLVADWQAGATNPNVAAQLFNGNGTAKSLAFLPATSSGSSDSLIQEDIVALSNGNFVVTWVDSLVQSQSTTLSTIYAQIYDSSQNPVGGRITIVPQLSGTIGSEDVSPLPNGGFIYAFTVGQSVYTQSFQSNGNKIGGQVNTGYSAPAFTRIAGLTNGNSVILTGNFDGFEVPMATRLPGRSAPTAA
jgi:hypothetical protein